MGLNKWEFREELKELCAKCVGLKPATAKKYAQDLYNKFSSEEGCISFYSDKEYKENRKLTRALADLKAGVIISDNSSLKIEDISYVDFQEKVIEITTKHGKVIRYGEGFEYLEYVFKRPNY